MSESKPDVPKADDHRDPDRPDHNTGSPGSDKPDQDKVDAKNEEMDQAGAGH
ncbi:MAG: hypothetical protein ACR2NA_08085 [Solirubrobacterales bacterium]